MEDRPVSVLLKCQLCSLEQVTELSQHPVLISTLM